MVYFRKPTFWILAVAFSLYLLLIFPRFAQSFFAYDTLANIWWMRKIVEDPLLIFRPNFMGRFHPFYYAFILLMDRFFGFNSSMYGLINWFLHILNSLLLFLLLRCLMKFSKFPATLTLIFFLFSSNQWGVLWEIGQTHRLACVSLCLLCIISFIQFVATKKMVHFVSSWIFFVLSFGFVEDAVTLPFLLLFVLFLFSPKRLSGGEKIIWTSPFFFVSLIVVFLSFSVKAPQGWGLTIGPHMAMNFVFLIRELVQFLLIPRSEFVPLSGIPGVFLRLLPPLLIFSFSGIVWYWRKDQILNTLLLPSVGRILIFGIAWIWITSLLYALRPMEEAWHGRYLYFPGVGMAIIVGVLLYQIWRSLRVPDSRIPGRIQWFLRGGLVGITFYGLVLNASTVLLMVDKARAGVKAATQEEIPIVFSVVSAIRDQFGAPLEMPPHTTLWIEGLPFSLARLEELLPSYYISAPSMMIEAKGGRPLKDFPRERNQRILYLKWEGENLSVVSSKG